MKWSSAELALLSDHAKADDIAKTIGRSLSSIRSMADRLKIYLVMPDSYYAEVRKNKIHKEVNCIICGTKFTQKNKHNTMCGSQECFRQNQRNIQNKNNRNNGVKERDDWWTPEQIKVLEGNRFASTDELAELTGRSKTSIKEKRCRLGLCRLALCKSCGKEHKYINQYETCEDCVPDQKTYAKNYGKGINGKYFSYRNNAIRRGVLFRLTFKEFSNFWQKPCTYCGSEIETIGLDRVDNDKDYTLDNVVSCCKRCNEIKLHYSVDEWVSHMKKILTNLGVCNG